MWAVHWANVPQLRPLYPPDRTFSTMLFGTLNQSHTLERPEQECKSHRDVWQHLEEPLAKT